MQKYTKNVDWWAVGILIYEMIIGKTPFFSPNRKTTMLSIREKPLRFPPEINYSPAVKHLISKLLDRNPDPRLGS